MLKIGNKVPSNIFIGGEEISKVYKGETLIFNNKSIELTSLAGAFDVTVSGFVNPVWEYNGEIQSGNTGKFTILNDNDIVTLSWDSLESNTQFTVNSAGRTKFNTKLENFRKKITNYLSLTNCSQITGDLSDLGGNITYFLNLYNCQKITGDLSDLDWKITNYLDLTNCTKITGDLSDLGGKITNFLSLTNCTKITGDLSDLGGKITNTLRLTNCTKITGDLSDLGGKITNYLSLTNCSQITGDLSDLGGKITNYLSLTNCSQITGDLADLGGKITNYLDLANCSQITGDLSDLGGKITYYLSLYNCSQITGDLSDLGGKITYYLRMYNCSKITGDLADLGGKITHTLNLQNCSQITGIYTPINSSAVPSKINLSNTGLTASDMDATLNNISITTKTNGTFTANGMSRTSASDSAVEKLVSQGWTISGITKIKSPLDDYSYDISNDSVTLLFYKGTETNVIIPSEIDGNPVKTIESTCFTENNIEQAVIPNTVTKIY